MSSFERKEYARQILEIKFEDGSDYTQAELDAMTDDELKKCFESETAGAEASEVEIDIEKCIVCEKLVECPFEDEETHGPVCGPCAAEAEYDDTPIGDEDDPDSEEDDEDSDEFEEEFEDDEEGD